MSTIDINEIAIELQRAAITILDQRSRLDMANAKNEKLHARVRDREIQFNGRQQALDELKAEVSRLTAELAAARKPQPLTELVTWVPVTERVPDSNRDVMVMMGGVYRGHYAPVGWIIDGDDEDWTEYVVTHWCELRGPALGAQDGGEDQS